MKTTAREKKKPGTNCSGFGMSYTDGIGKCNARDQQDDIGTKNQVHLPTSL